MPLHTHVNLICVLSVSDLLHTSSTLRGAQRQIGARPGCAKLCQQGLRLLSCAATRPRHQCEAMHDRGYVEAEGRGSAHVTSGVALRGDVGVGATSHSRCQRHVISLQTLVSTCATRSHWLS